MPDLFRLVTIDDVGRARLLIDLNDPATSGVYRERDTFAIQPAEGRVGYAQGSSRYAGAIAQTDLDDNDTVSTGLVIRATDPAAAAATIERLLAYMDRLGASSPLWLEWRAAGLPRSIFFPVRGPGSFTPLYAARVWDDAKAFRCTVSWPVAPLGEGLPLDLTEDFRPPSDKVGGLTNLVPNPSAEVDTAGWGAAAAPYLTGTGTISRIAATTARGQVGASMGRLQTAGAVGVEGNAQALPGTFKVGRTYRVTGILNGNGGTAPLIQAFIGSASAGGDSAGQTVGPVGSAAVVYPFAFTWVPNGDRSDVVFGLRTQSAGAVAADVLFDQLQIVDVTGVAAAAYPAYFDGDSTTARWEGTAHASRSIEVAENMLADYTIDAGSPVSVRQDVANSNATGAFAAAPTTPIRFRHTGRGYSFYDGAIAAGVRLPDAITATITTVKAGKIVGGATGRVVYAYLDVSTANNILYLLRENPPGNNQTIILSSGLGTPFPAGSRVWVRLVIQGRYARAEAWTSSPTRGGVPAYTTAWADVGAAGADGSNFGFEDAGTAIYGFTGGQASARLIELHEHPYTYADVKSPDEVLLRGVPGNAPARADVEIAAAAGTTLPFGLVGWRPRTRVHNIIWNGNVEDDVDGWSSAGIFGLVAGGSVSRIATGGVQNEPYLAVTSAAGAAATGVAFSVFERIRRGRVYTVELWIAGTDAPGWETFLILDAGTPVAVSAAGSFAAIAGWSRYVVSVVAPADATRLDFVLRRQAAGAFTVWASRIRVYEGAPTADPDTVAQSAGRGAWPPFGLILPLSDDASARAGMTTAANAAAPGGQVLQASSSTWSARYPIDPALLLDAIDDTVIDVEVYAMLACPSTISGATLTLSAMPDKGPGRRVYTREYGGAGRGVLKPVAGTTYIAHRLGTLPLEVSRRSTGRWNLILDYTSAGSVAVQLMYLVVVPVLKRAGSPTGKYNDSYYPTFATMSANTPGKLIESSGRGFALAGQGGVYRDASIGGEPIEVDPGDNELLVWTFAGGVPDQPDGATGTPSETTLTRVRARVTPRYRLMRDV